MRCVQDALLSRKMLTFKSWQGGLYGWGCRCTFFRVLGLLGLFSTDKIQACKRREVLSLYCQSKPAVKSTVVSLHHPRFFCWHTDILQGCSSTTWTMCTRFHQDLWVPGHFPYHYKLSPAELETFSMVFHFPGWYIISSLRAYLSFTPDKSFFQRLRVSIT